MPRKSETPVEVMEEIAALIAAGETRPAAIHSYLERKFKDTDVRVDSVRTIQRRVNELLPIDTSGPWSIAEASPEGLARVLPVVTAIVEMTRGRVWPTQELVRWIDRIVAAAPDIPVAAAYWAALQMRAAAALNDQGRRDEVLALLTVQIGCRPWTPEGRRRWRRLQAQAPPSPTLDVLLDTLDFTLPADADTAADDGGEGLALLQRAYREQSHHDHQEDQDDGDTTREG